MIETIMNKFKGLILQVNIKDKEDKKSKILKT